MLRLVLLLGASIYATLLIAGADNGQLRPGLAKAAAEGRPVVVLERSYSEVVPPSEETPFEVIDTPPPPVEIVTAAYVPAPAPAPEPAARKAAPQPVFTLSALPTASGDVADPAPELAEETSVSSSVLGEDQPRIWYVDARSVNVREGPSTDTGVIGRLTGGEEVTVLEMVGEDWARILIEGDGLQGYVATRLLSPGP